MRSNFAAVILSLITLNSYAGLFGFGGDSWQEEVLLHDGRKLVVERQTERGGRHEIGQKPSYIRQTLSFKHPASGRQMVWEDKATPDLGNSNFLPMALDVYSETVYLVVTPMGCLSYNKWGRPNPPYVVFRYDDKAWNRVNLDELPAETKVPNMISSSPDTEVERLGKRFIDSETIHGITSEYRQLQNRTILRERSAIENGCITADYYPNAGWLSPDWFSDQPSLDACLKFCKHKQIESESCPCNRLYKGNATR
jgi:hypothetical protein